MKHFKELVKEFIEGISKNDLFAYSSSCAYYTFICLIPFLTLILLLVAYTPLTKETILLGISEVIPKSIVPFASNIVDEFYNPSGVILPITLISMWWPVTGIMVSLRRGLNKIYHVEEKKNFLAVRLMSTLVMMIAINIILLVTILANFSDYAISLLSQYNNSIINFIISILDIHTMIMLVSFFIVFTFIYAFISQKRVRLKHCIPGALFTTIGCFIYTQIYSYLLSNYLTYSMYGSLATIVIIMIFFNFLYILFFFGAYINQFIEEKKVY